MQNEFWEPFSRCGSNNCIGQSALKQALTVVLWGKKDNLAFADEFGTVGQVYPVQYLYIFGAF